MKKRPSGSSDSEWSEKKQSITKKIDSHSIEALTKTLGPFNHILEADIKDLQDIKKGGQGIIRIGKIKYMGWCVIKKLEAVPSYQKGPGLDSLRELIQSYVSSFNPHIVRFYGILYSEIGPQGIIMELMEGGDLHNYLSSNAEISLASKVTYALHIARAVGAMHASNRIHRDIKPANVFLSGDKSVAKLGDFGFSKDLFPVNTTKKGTYQYVAPELMVGEQAAYGCEVDVYSFAMTVYHIFTRKIPFSDEGVPNVRNVALFQRRVFGQIPGVPSRPEFPDNIKIPSIIRTMIERSWAEHDRPSMAEICDILEAYVEENKMDDCPLVT